MIWAFDQFDYVDLEADRLGGEATALELGSLQSGLITRAIPREKTLCDGVSVYGYPSLPAKGPLSEIVDKFAEAARTKSMVAAYLRFGGDVFPALSTDSWQLRDVGEIITVDLRPDYEAIEAGFRKGLRYDIRKARQLFSPVKAENAIGEFHTIYTENMTRVNAAPHYFFDAEYFERLTAIEGFDCWTVRKDGQLAAAAITARHGDRLYYHLGATADRFSRENPVKHLLASIIAVHAGGSLQHMVLGGGVGGQRDSLFKFKTGFSSQITMSQSLCVICDPERYDRLSGGAPRFEGFFPAYRG